MSSHNLNRKLEAAVRQLFLGNEVAEKLKDFSQDDGQNIYTGAASGVKRLPCVIIAATGGTEDPPLSGIFTVTLEVMVKTAFKASAGSNDQLPKSSALVEAVGDALNSINLNDDLNAVSDGGISVLGHYDITTAASQEEDAWVESFSLRVCCVGFTAH